MFLVLRCGQNCSILVWPPQRPCDLHLTKTKIYLPKLPSMLNLKSIRPLGAILKHQLSEEPDFAIPLSLKYDLCVKQKHHQCAQRVLPSAANSEFISSLNILIFVLLRKMFPVAKAPQQLNRYVFHSTIDIMIQWEQKNKNIAVLVFMFLV